MSLKNKAVLISIRPEWCDLIVQGKKPLRCARPVRNWKRRSRCTSTARKFLIGCEL